MAPETDPQYVASYADLDARGTFLATDHDDAVERVREAFTDAGRGIPTEFSPSENVGEHTGDELPPTRVIGIGTPHAGTIVAALTRGDAAPLSPGTAVVRRVSQARRRVYHLSLQSVLERLGFAPEDDSDARAEVAALAGNGVAEASETLTASDIAVNRTAAPADD